MLTERVLPVTLLHVQPPVLEGTLLVSSRRKVHPPIWKAHPPIGRVHQVRRACQRHNTPRYSHLWRDCSHCPPITSGRAHLAPPRVPLALPARPPTPPHVAVASTPSSPHRHGRPAP
eukprot:157355-Prymnesium_polylepis.1